MSALIRSTRRSGWRSSAQPCPVKEQKKRSHALYLLYRPPSPLPPRSICPAGRCDPCQRWPPASSKKRRGKVWQTDLSSGATQKRRKTAALLSKKPPAMPSFYGKRGGGAEAGGGCGQSARHTLKKKKGTKKGAVRLRAAAAFTMQKNDKAAFPLSLSPLWLFRRALPLSLPLSLSLNDSLSDVLCSVTLLLRSSASPSFSLPLLSLLSPSESFPLPSSSAPPPPPFLACPSWACKLLMTLQEG